MDARVYREDILRMLVSHATDSFKEKVRVAALIEDKAQKTAGLGGVFLAAGFGFVKSENLSPASPLGGFWTLLPLTLAIIGLILTILICLGVLWIREQAAPISMVVMKKIVGDIMALPDAELSFELQDRSRIQVTKVWIEILDRQEKANLKKALGVKLAQGLLTVSILLVAFSLLIVLTGSVASRIVSAFKG